MRQHDWRAPGRRYPAAMHTAPQEPRRLQLACAKRGLAQPRPASRSRSRIRIRSLSIGTMHPRPSRGRGLQRQTAAAARLVVRLGHPRRPPPARPQTPPCCAARAGISPTAHGAFPAGEPHLRLHCAFRWPQAPQCPAQFYRRRSFLYQKQPKAATRDFRDGTKLITIKHSPYAYNGWWHVGSHGRAGWQMVVHAWWRMVVCGGWWWWCVDDLRMMIMMTVYVVIVVCVQCVHVHAYAIWLRS